MNLCMCTIAVTWQFSTSAATVERETLNLKKAIIKADKIINSTLPFYDDIPHSSHSPFIFIHL